VGADQFTQHVVCTLGGEVREVPFSGAAAMVNLLDDKFPATLPEGGVRSLIQTYGKGLRKGRKVGHVTLLGTDTQIIRDAAHHMIDELHGSG
jgi:5-(carboxyamino)imidazole ribonucleotide synthase